MTLGPGRFEYYLIQTEDLLLKASQSANAAIYLYENDARTSFFMLEGLSKLYAGLHNEKKFEKLQLLFKELEDALGGIDYYDNFAKSLTPDSELSNQIYSFFNSKKEEKITFLNELLISRKWINHDPLRTKKIRVKLKGADWKNQKTEKELIKKFYKKTILSIIEFYQSTGETFTDIELQVHDLRRKLRWLSIYPRALQGAIQLHITQAGHPLVQKYLTQEIVHSPYNKMPAQGACKEVLLLDQNYFLALSYTIAALGKLKDSGLKITAVAEALRHIQKSDEAQSQLDACDYLNLPGNELENILGNAKGLCSIYFQENNIDKLIYEDTLQGQS